MAQGLSTTSARRRASLVTVLGATLLLGLPTGSAEARWSPPRVISDRSHANRIPVAAGDGKGSALVAWERSPSDPAAPSSATVMMRQRHRDGHWGALRRVSPVMQLGGSPAVAMNAHGDGVVLYAETVSGFLNRIMVRRVTRSGHLGPARVLARGDFVAPDSLAIDGAGDVVLAWDSQHLAFHVTVLRANGTRTPAATLASDGSDVLSAPVLTTAGRRAVAMAWTDGVHVHAQRVSPSGALGADVVVSGPTEAGSAVAANPHLADDGTIAVTWYRQFTPQSSPAYAAWLHPDGSVVRRPVTGPDSYVTGLWSTADAQGGLQVAWLSGAGTFGPGLTRHLDASGPPGQRHRITAGALGISLTEQADGSGLMWWQPVGPARHARTRTYSATGRLGDARRAPPATDPTAIAPLGGLRYLLAAWRYETDGRATRMSVRIGP